MRPWLTLALVGGGLLAGGSTPAQEPVPGKTPPVAAEAKVERNEPPPLNREVDSVLAAWAKQAATRTTLQVAFERVDRSPKWGDKRYSGQAFYRGADLCLEFRLAKTEADDKPVRFEGGGRSALVTEREPTERLVLTPQAITQFMGDIHQVHVYPLQPKPFGWVAASLAGARWSCDLPFLHNRTVAEVQQRYQITLIDQKNPTRAAKTHLLQFVPRQETDRQFFHKAYLGLDRTTFLPDRLTLFSPGSSDRQDFLFTSVVVNQPIPDSVFSTDRIPAGWKVVRTEPDRGLPIEEWFWKLVRLNTSPPDLKANPE